MNIYTVKSTDIVHNTSVDLITRWSTREVHIVQYDNSQPIVAVELFKNSERFVLPDGYEANLRFGKKDRTFIYKPVLGCNQGRDTVYFAVDEQMSMFYGKVTPIIELTYNGAVVGSSSIPFVIDRNPIQIGDVESKTDYPAIVERISAAEASVADAKKAVDAEAAERAAGDAKTLSDARAYTDSSTSGLISDSTTIKSNITTLQSDVASLKTDNTQNKTDISTLKGNYTAIQSQVNTNSSDITTKQDKLVSGTNIKTINGNSILGTGDITISGGGTNYITETTDKLILKPVNTNGNDFEVRTKDNDVVVSFTQNAPGNSSSYSLFDVVLSTAPNEDGELYNIVARFTKDENWDAKLNLSASAGSIGAGFDITIPPDAYGNIAMASDLEPLKTSIGNKQDTLVSGTNIKTINGESILGSGNITISGGSGSGSGGSGYFDVHPTNIKESPDSTSDFSLEFNITESEYNEILTNKRNVRLFFPAEPEQTSSDETIDIKFEYDTNTGLFYYYTGPAFKSTIVENYDPTVTSESMISYATLMLFKDGKSYRGRYSEHSVYRLTAPWSIDENYLGVWSKSSPNLSENDFFEGLQTNGDFVGFVATNFTSNDTAIIMPALTSDIPLFQFMKADGSVTSMVKLPNDFFTRSQTINLGDIANSGGSSGSGGSGSARPPLYSHTITLKDNGNSAYFTFTIYIRTDEEITKNNLFDYLNWDVCSGIGVVSNALIDKITFSTRADNTWVHKFLELSGQHIDEEPTFDSVFGTDFTVEDVVRGPDWIPPR